MCLRYGGIKKHTYYKFTAKSIGQRIVKFD